MTPITAPTAPTGPELDRIRAKRFRQGAKTKAKRDAARRAEVLAPAALRDALTSPAGLRAVQQALAAHHRGHIGQVRRPDIAAALEALLAPKE